MGTAAWYGDSRLTLALPDSWSGTVHRPSPGPPLGPEGIGKVFAAEPGQALAAMARGCTRPVVLVDDLTRPTPAAQVLPHVLEAVAAGSASPVTVLVAGGSHAPPSRTALERKLGTLPPRCEVAVHDYRGRAVSMGRTSFGTPVLVDPLVAGADLLVGVGGIYPQHSTGFGGGSKIVLGAMAERSIVALHYGHRPVGGTYDITNDFRRDLDEAARLAGLAAAVNVFVDDAREIVRVLLGPPATYYSGAVGWAREAFRAAPPGEADVVISNAYPMDVSLTFVRSKGMSPLQHARAGASRIVVASCPEGAGHHGLFPFPTEPRFHHQRHLLRLLRARRRELPRIAYRRVRGVARQRSRAPAEAPPFPIALFVPPPWGTDLPDSAPGMRVHRTWDSVLDQVAGEQQRDVLRAAVYTCAPLQVIEAA